VVLGATTLRSLPELGASAPGVGVLTVTRSAGRSVVSSAYATSPLRLLTPSNHGRAAWIFTSSYGGGLVDGDRIRLEIEVGDGAAAFVSTQASTKVYRSPRGTAATMSARIGPAGLLVIAPDPVVCFARSRYRQVQRFQVADTGTLVAVDWLSSGRRAFGERWMFDEYEATLEVRKGGRLLVHDALALRARDGNLAERLGRFEVLAVVTLAGALVHHEACGIVSRVNARPLSRGDDLLIAATALGDEGCVVRMGGTSVEHVGKTIRDLLRAVPALLGDDPWSSKW
jgi:urease accessory protein